MELSTKKRPGFIVRDLFGLATVTTNPCGIALNGTSVLTRALRQKVELHFSLELESWLVFPSFLTSGSCLKRVKANGRFTTWTFVSGNGLGETVPCRGSKIIPTSLTRTPYSVPRRVSCVCLDVSETQTVWIKLQMSLSSTVLLCGLKEGNEGMGAVFPNALQHGENTNTR